MKKLENFEKPASIIFSSSTTTTTTTTTTSKLVLPIVSLVIIIIATMMMIMIFISPCCMSCQKIEFNVPRGIYSYKIVIKIFGLMIIQELN